MTPTKNGGRAALPGTWVIFDELTPESCSTEKLAKLITAKPYRRDVVYCDPAGDGVQPAFGISDVQVLQKAGIGPVRFVTDERLRHIPFGIGLLGGLFLNVIGEIRLYIAEQLVKPRAARGVVKDVESYHYPAAKSEHAVKDVPVKDGVHDHSMDAWRYFAINEYAGTATSVGGPIQIR